MNVSRRKTLAGATGVATFGILHWHGAHAAEFTFKLGHDQPVIAPLHLRSEEAAKKIAEESGGRLVVQVYPATQLGSDTQMLAQLRSGALELLLLGDNILGQVVPAANDASLPFAFGGYEQEFSVLDGPLGKYIHGQIEKIGLHCFDKNCDIGLRHVFTSARPVHTAADMKGLKLRVPEAPVQVACFRALGSSPTPLDTSEMYTAIQLHLVDGAEQPLATIEYQKLYEVSKYITLTAHQGTSFEVMANGMQFNRLPKNLQEILAKNLDQMAVLHRQDCIRDETDLKGKLQAQNQTIIAPDRESFRKVIQEAGLYTKWRDAYGAEPFALLEKAVGKLA
jgi:tripartite ATP-independent transporter DctP family solute receptor